MRPKPNDIVRVLRLVEYVGPRSWVERTLGKSIQGTLQMGASRIKVIAISSAPEVIVEKEDAWSAS